MRRFVSVKLMLLVVLILLIFDYEIHPSNKASFRKEKETLIDSIGEIKKKPTRIVRSLPEGNAQKKYITCEMAVTIDPVVWDRYVEDNRSIEYARQQITSVVTELVQGLNDIYAPVDFDGKYHFNNIRFKIKKLYLEEFRSFCQPGNSTVNPISNPFCGANIKESSMLELYSQFNWNDYCISLLVTDRYFNGSYSDGFQGDANLNVGVCARQRKDSQNRATTRNVAWINFGKKNRSMELMQVLLGHQVGHLLGSPDDHPVECIPQGNNGKYIMSKTLISKVQENSKRFSTCSLRNISMVLDAIQDGKKVNCFAEWKGATCGNGIVEEWEQCDCPVNDSKCQKCCYPSPITINEFQEALKTSGCKLRPGATCTSNEGPCCSSNCTFLPVDYPCQTMGSGGCLEISSCSGKSAHCPRNESRSDSGHCDTRNQHFTTFSPYDNGGASESFTTTEKIAINLTNTQDDSKPTIAANFYTTSDITTPVLDKKYIFSTITTAKYIDEKIEPSTKDKAVLEQYTTASNTNLREDTYLSSMNENVTTASAAKFTADFLAGQDGTVLITDEKMANSTSSFIYGSSSVSSAISDNVTVAIFAIITNDFSSGQYTTPLDTDHGMDTTSTVKNTSNHEKSNSTLVFDETATAQNTEELFVEEDSNISVIDDMGLKTTFLEHIRNFSIGKSNIASDGNEIISEQDFGSKIVENKTLESVTNFTEKVNIEQNRIELIKDDIVIQLEPTENINLKTVEDTTELITEKNATSSKKLPPNPEKTYFARKILIICIVVLLLVSFIYFMTIRCKSPISNREIIPLQTV